MTDTVLTPLKRIILRAILNDVNPIVARVIAIPDNLEISDLHEVFLSIFGWVYDSCFIIRIHAQVRWIPKTGQVAKLISRSSKLVSRGACHEADAQKT